MSVAPRTLLVIKHVPWEGPHRILDSCNGLDVRTVETLGGDRLPDHAEVGGALVMGGPMNVDEVERYPGLAAEREWIAAAMSRKMPILGICLGAQLIARALGVEVRPGKRAEIGFSPVQIYEPDDPILGSLAPQTAALHWHGDVFDLPDGATRLASSEQTALQAFRLGNAWGVLFHPEADVALVEAWLAEPTMAEEARGVLGDDGPAAIRGQAQVAERQLAARSTQGFEAFANLLRKNSLRREAPPSDD
jgi:GMP synthase (glutamine-hydrolysing)